MLRAVRDDGEGGLGGGLDAQELRDQCMTIFQAGHETTATALSWWGGLMARHPEAQQRARAEVQALLGSGHQARDPAPADLARLPWLSATLKEAMRLYPPIAALMTRRNTREITVAGYRVPAGRLIRITPWVLHRDPRWFPQPEAWLPERWLDGSADAAPRGAYMPFGTGPRVCLGQHFALMEMTLIAAMTLQGLSLHADPGEPLPPPDMQVTLRPKGGMVLRFGAVEGASSAAA
jgi:cytochrome P450